MGNKDIGKIIIKIVLVSCICDIISFIGGYWFGESNHKEIEDAKNHFVDSLRKCLDDKKESCLLGCNFMYDEINFKELLGTWENRTITNQLLDQCVSDCEARGKYYKNPMN